VSERIESLTIRVWSGRECCLKLRVDARRAGAALGDPEA